MAWLTTGSLVILGIIGVLVLLIASNSIKIVRDYQDDSCARVLLENVSVKRGPALSY